MDEKNMMNGLGSHEEAFTDVGYGKSSLMASREKGGETDHEKHPPSNQNQTGNMERGFYLISCNFVAQSSSYSTVDRTLC